MHPATLALCAYRGHAAPLPIVADFITALARAVQKIAAQANQPIQTGVEAHDAMRNRAGGWTIRARRNADGAEIELATRHLVVATGAEQSTSQLRTLSVSGQPLWPRYQDKLMLSRAVLNADGLATASQILARSEHPHVAIIGGSHSAMSAARVLLDLPGIEWRRESIAILHRTPLRPMYPSPDLARAEGYHAFGPNDICPKTGRVFPLAGFRSDARELLLRVLGLGKRPREQRIALIDVMRRNGGDIAAILERADIVIAATGYRPRALPLHDRDGRRIKLLAECFGSAAMVDHQSRLLDASAVPIPGVFGIGLSAGFPLEGTHGEPSFRGQANGLALWHSEIGAAIVSSVLDDSADQAAFDLPIAGSGRRPDEIQIS